MAIPDPFLPEEAGAIPNILGAMPVGVEAPESESYSISFKRYKESECELSGGAIIPYALDALKAIKSLGMHAPRPGGEGGKSYGAATEQVHNANEYTKLFRGLDDLEIDMREVKLEGKEKRMDYRRDREVTETVRLGRLFFYEVKNVIYVIAIRATHYETTKR